MDKPKILQMHERGQIVIPKEVREDMHLERGSMLALFEIGGDNLVLRKVEHPKLEDWDKILGSLQKAIKERGLKEEDADKWVSVYRKKKR